MPCGQWEGRILIPKFTQLAEWGGFNQLHQFNQLECFAFKKKKKKFENHHPEKEYFIHAGLSNEGENIQYSKWNLKKKKTVSMNFQKHLENWQKN